MTRRRGVLTLLVGVLALMGARPTPAAVETPFPCSDAMREGVLFWKNVWTRWTLE